MHPGHSQQSFEALAFLFRAVDGNTQAGMLRDQSDQFAPVTVGPTPMAAITLFSKAGKARIEDDIIPVDTAGLNFRILLQFQ